MSYVSSLFHIVFSTYCRKPVISLDNKSQLYAVMGNEIKKLKSKPLIINGIHDHVHILVGLHQSVALASLVRDIKSKSSVWMKESRLFPYFEGWEREYGAFSISYSHLDPVYKYIERQEEHHLGTTSEDEFQRLVKKAGMRVYEEDI